jgi:hypothetical protein
MDASTFSQAPFIQLAASDWRCDYGLMFAIPDHRVRIKVPCPTFDKLSIEVHDSRPRVFKLVPPAPPLPDGVYAQDHFLRLYPDNSQYAEFFWVGPCDGRAAVAVISIADPEHPEREIRLEVVHGEMRHYETDLPAANTIIYGEAERQ